MNDINHALIEDTRPPRYTAFKYTGKKPHNIWKKLIEFYTPKDGLYFDPFMGSGIGVVEAAASGRKSIGFDLNPFSRFQIEVYATANEFDLQKFTNAVNKIQTEVENDLIYQKYFTTTSRLNPSKKTVIQHALWQGGKITKLGIFAADEEEQNQIKKLQKDTKKAIYSNGRMYVDANIEDQKLSKEMKNIDLIYWYPKKEFQDSPSFSSAFINSVGSNNYSDLWTRRNLYLLSKIYDEILKVKDPILIKQLIYGFMMSVHLTFRMNVPRLDEKTNRLFSTSWGRSAFLISDNEFEQNPLPVFIESCLRSKMSVRSCLFDLKNLFPDGIKLKIVSDSNREKNNISGFDIKTGCVDINSLKSFIKDKSIDFILTDPPYGDLVQYLDITSIWNIWLERYDPELEVNYESELVIKKNVIPKETYELKLLNAFKEMNRVLKDDSKLILTFHSKNIEIWNLLLRTISLSGFTVEKLFHQVNRRSGESQVANPFGTSSSDIYIRCVKSKADLNTDENLFRHYVIETAINIIAMRNEPTPWDFLFPGILAVIANKGFDLSSFDKDVKEVLESRIDDIFVIENKIFQNGKTPIKQAVWWFQKPENHIKFPNLPLSERVEESIKQFLRLRGSATHDEIINHIFIQFPNGLTPSISSNSLGKLILKFADKSSDRYIIKTSVESEATNHTKVIYDLVLLGKKMGFKTFVGKREQHEPINNKKLKDFVDFHNLKFLNFEKDLNDRIEMIDLIWLDDKKIQYVLEVENSTNFTSAIQRASNLNSDIPKIMIVPNERINELKKIKDPLFINNFKDHNWKYLEYKNINKINKSTIDKLLNNLD